MSESGKLQIAFFIEGMEASGVETSTRLVSQALVRLGHSVTVFTPWVRQDEEEGVRYFRLQSMRMPTEQPVYWSMPVNIGVLDEFRAHHYDVVHLHTSTMVGALVWQVSKRRDLPIVYTYHTMTKDYAHYLWPFVGQDAAWLSNALEHYDRMVCNQTAAVVAPSKKAANYLAELDIIPPVTVIPNGIRTDRFCPGKSDYLQRKFGIPYDAPVLLFVGRLNVEKRPDGVYEVFRKVSEQRGDVHLVMAGVGPLGEEIREKSRQNGLESRLHFTGAVAYEVMPEVYRSATVWVSTSQSEVHPMVALEAAASGLPAAVIVDPALDGVVLPGQNGVVASGTDALAEQLLLMLDDEARMSSMADASAEIGQRYSVDATARRLADLYAGVVSTLA